MRDSDAYYNYILLRSLYSVLYGYYQHEEFLLRWKKIVKISLNTIHMGH